MHLAVRGDKLKLDLISAQFGAQQRKRLAATSQCAAYILK
jgi:hypothetical protein